MNLWNKRSFVKGDSKPNVNNFTFQNSKNANQGKRKRVPNLGSSASLAWIPFGTSGLSPPSHNFNHNFSHNLPSKRITRGTSVSGFEILPFLAFSVLHSTAESLYSPLSFPSVLDIRDDRFYSSLPECQLNS